MKPEKEPDYRGYPLVADATGYAVWFYGFLPAISFFLVVCASYWNGEHKAAIRSQSMFGADYSSTYTAAC